MVKYLKILLFVVTCNIADAQTEIPKDVKETGETLKRLPNLSYEYVVTRYYDLNNIDSIKGKFTTFNEQCIESSSNFMLIQDKKWFYKVDHEGKYVVVAKNSKFRSEKSMSNSLSYFSDSVYYKFGKINVTTERNIQKITMTFSKETTLRSIYLEFDKVKGIPVVYRIVMDIPNEGNSENSESNFTRQVFIGRNFSSKKGKQKANLSDYFVLSGNDVKLKKYSNYKLYQFL